MDDDELDFSIQKGILSIPSSCSMENLLDELLKDTYTCTHTHTCNPPGPDHPHIHTCFHTHTKIVSAPTEDKVATVDAAETSKSKKRPSGNGEASRKYREKQKARTASLEEEVDKLRDIIQQLEKRLQEQAVLEAEIVGLKCLLFEIRGRIEGEIGSFPYQQSANNVNFINPNPPGACVMNPCDVQCNDQVYCLHPGVDGKNGEGMAINGQGFSGCEFGNIQCLVNQNLGMKELPGCSLGNQVTHGNSSGKHE